MFWRVRESPRMQHLGSYGLTLAPLSVWTWQDRVITMFWNRRNITVPPMSHLCPTYVPPMSHPCPTYVTLTTRLRNKICYLELFLDKSQRLQVVIGHRREKIKNHSVKWNHYVKEVQTFITNQQTNTHAHKHTRMTPGEWTAMGHIIVLWHCYFGDGTSASKQTFS